MTSKEHTLMIFMLTRQAMLIKTLADILKNNGIMVADSVVSQEEIAHLPILRIDRAWTGEERSIPSIQRRSQPGSPSKYARIEFRPYFSVDALVAANRHPGQVGYSLSPPQEVRDEESSLRAGPGEEGEGQVAHAAARTARERQRQSDLPLFRSVQGALLHLEEAL